MGVVLLLFIMVGWGGSLDRDRDEVEYVSALPDRLYGWDFKGLNWRLSDYVWERDGTYQIMRDYGVNMIRRHFAGEPVYSNITSYMNRITRTAEEAAERGMYVIFDLFSWDDGTDSAIRRQQEHNWDPNDSTWGDARWNQLWTNIGNLVKDYDNVILELGNEPDDYNNTGWTAAMYERQRARYAATITLLRNLGFNGPIGIPGTAYGTTLSNWVSRASSLNDSNIIFDIHYYQEYQGGSGTESGIRTYMNNRGCDDLLNAGYRVMVGEFGVKGSENNQSSTQRTWFQNFLKVQRDDGYDSCFQSFQPGTDFPGIQGDWGDSQWPSRTPTTPMRWFLQGWDSSYTGVPSNLEYYDSTPPPPPPSGEGNLVVSAAYTNGAAVNAAGRITSQAYGNYGFSSYPRTDGGAYSTSIIDDILAAMRDEGLNIYRMSIWYTLDDTTRNQMVRYFLENSAYDLIVCYHDYPAAGMRPNWATAQAWVLSLCAEFADMYGDRLWIEFANERTDADLANQCQTIVTAVRNAGYTTVKLVCNKWTQSWSSMAGVSDPNNLFYTGYHYYFNTWSVNGAIADMQAAQAQGITKLINTEIGADSNEETQFSNFEVSEVNEFMQWCLGQSISATVWQRYGLQNYDTYQAMNLTFPRLTVIYQNTTPFTAPLDPGVYYLTVTFTDANDTYTDTRVTTVYADTNTYENFVFPLPTPPPTVDEFTVQILGATGGSIVPSPGTYVLLVTQLFNATAYAATDYVFTRWLRDNVEYTTTSTIAFNGNPNVYYTVQPVFTYTPGETEESIPDWRYPNPYEPTPETTPPTPSDGASQIPRTLPDAVTIVDDARFFTDLVKSVSRMRPPSLDELMRIASSSTYPNFTITLKQLQQMRLSA
jgi:hypothetical protein